MANRIGDECWFQPHGEKEYRRGTLRMWSTDHEEFESCPGLFPVAVIEDSETGEMQSVHVGRVTFGVRPTK